MPPWGDRGWGNGVVILRQDAAEEWLHTAVVRPYVRLDEFIVMPSHVHGIICIVDDDVGRGTACRAPGTERRFGDPIAGSLPTIVGAFKSAVTKRINRIRNTPAARV